MTHAESVAWALGRIEAQTGLPVAPDPHAVTIPSLEKQVLALGTSAPAEAVADVLNRVQVLTREIKRVKDLWEQIAIEWIQANGDLQIGDMRYYVGHPKTTKCNDIPATVEALMQATGGDFRAFCECLSAGAIKHGAAKKVLAESDFARLFSVTEQTSLEEGKPTKKLCSVNERFLSK